MLWRSRRRARFATSAHVFELKRADDFFGGCGALGPIERSPRPRRRDRQVNLTRSTTLKRSSLSPQRNTLHTRHGRRISNHELTRARN